MMKIRILILAVVTFAFVSCGDTSSSVETKLTGYGFPFSVVTSDSLEIKESKGSIFKQIKLLNYDKNYAVKILGDESLQQDLPALLKREKDDVMGTSIFSSIVEEHEDGFIYTNIVKGQEMYNFRHVKIKGDQEFIFQNDIIVKDDNTYSPSLEDVKAMYTSVKGNEAK